jgi:hypothetical protein
VDTATCSRQFFSANAVRLLEPLLETLNLRYWNIDEEVDIANVAKAFEHAAEAKTAAVLIVGRHITWN